VSAHESNGSNERCHDDESMNDLKCNGMSEVENKIPSQAAERWPKYGICLLVLYATVRAIMTSITKPFWLDEILTWTMVHQPNVAAIWGGIRHGADSQPILFDLIERATTLIPDAEFGLRLPSAAGFACVLLCVFVFVRRRSGGVYGLVSAAILLLTMLYDPYAFEARPYSLVAACVAVALVAYQRASSLRWASLMAIALAAAECLHYYSVFTLIPFVAAEIILSLQTSKIRWKTWIALIIGATPLAVFWPIVAHLKAILSGDPSIWPTLMDFIRVYGTFLFVSSCLGLAVALMCGLSLFAEFISIRTGKLALDSEKRLANGTDGKFLHERVLIAFLLAMPLIFVLMTKLLHGTYEDRYVLYAVLGIAMAVGLVLPRLGRRTLILFSGFLVCTLAMQEGLFWRAHRHSLLRLQPPSEEMESLLHDTGHTDLPVVVADRIDYAALAHYASPPLASRLVLVTGPANAQYAAAEKANSLIAPYGPFRVYDFPTFRSAHPSFLLYSNFADLGDWWAAELVHYGFELRPVASDGDHILFLVSGPGTDGS
jgi:hypothetical protein